MESKKILLLEESVMNHFFEIYYKSMFDDGMDDIVKQELRAAWFTGIQIAFTFLKEATQVFSKEEISTIVVNIQNECKEVLGKEAVVTLIADDHELH